LALLGCGIVAIGASAQVTSSNIVGYINLSLLPGDNLIGNQLLEHPSSGLGYDLSLNNILSFGVANGSTFTKWDPLANEFLPVSIYNALSQSWSINYTLGPGEGALLHSPTLATNTFVGDVNSIFDVNTGILNWHPGYANAVYLLSCPVPLSNATFQQVVGRDPLNGEWVRTLNPVTQLYSITTYHTGIGWDNGAPSLAVGQAAWFDLGPVAFAVPEPGLCALGLLGTVLLLARKNQA
jgi:hypothetical protein